MAQSDTTTSSHWLSSGKPDSVKHTRKSNSINEGYTELHQLLDRFIPVPATSQSWGREIWPVEVEAFEDVHHYAPLGVDVVTGSLDIRNKDFALVVFVNRANPLAHLSLPQIAKLFGAEQKPPTTWGELGLTGEWARRPIHVYGFEIHRGFGYYLEQRVMNGSAKWNPALVELGDVKKADGSLLDAGQRIVDAIGADPDAIGYSSLLYKNPEVRPIPIGPAGGPFLLPTHETIANHSYALTRSITAAPSNQARASPPIRGVRHLPRSPLSPEGRRATVIEDGGYTAYHAGVGESRGIEARFASRQKIAGAARN